MVHSIYRWLSFAGTVTFAVQLVRSAFRDGSVMVLGSQIDERIIETVYIFGVVFCGATLLGLSRRSLTKRWRRFKSERPIARFMAMERVMADLAELYSRPEVPGVPWDTGFAGLRRADYEVMINDLMLELYALRINAPDPPRDHASRQEWAAFARKMRMFARYGDLSGARRYVRYEDRGA